MRLPAALRVPQYAGVVAALLLTGVLIPQSRAQFAGGVGDGYSVTGKLHIALDGAVPLLAPYAAGATGGDGYSTSGRPFIALDGNVPLSVLYTAGPGGGDGYSFAGRHFVPLDGAAPLLTPYASSGAGGDGYAFASLLNRAMDGAAVVLAAFKGGVGDGYDVDGVNSVSIDPNAAVFVIYNGGEGDGYDFDSLEQTALGLPVVVSEPYTAGESGGDGYDAGGAGYFVLDGLGLAAANEPFLGSPAGGDGYDDERGAFLALNGEQPGTDGYLGGGGDGYDDETLLHIVISPPLAAPENFYTGGEGDGYDAASLPFVQYMGGGEAASGVTYAGWLNSRFSEEERNAGLAAPAVDADHDGLANLVEFTLGSDPRNPDATVFGPDFRISNLSDLGYPALPDRHLTAIVRRNPLALDATLRVEITSDVSSLWDVDEIVPVDSAPFGFIVRDQFGIKTAPARSMRLRATLNP